MIGELLFPNRAYRRALGKALSAAGAAPSRGAIAGELRLHYKKIRREIPGSYPFQTRFLLKLAARNVALYRVMKTRGADAEFINDLLGKINWTVSKNIGRPLYLLSRVAGADRKKRLLFIDTLLYRYLFVKPFRRDILSRSPGLDFNITACPFAEFYKSQDAAGICRFAACGLDHDLAREWNVGFERTNTIADGGEWCDFRFIIKN